MGVCLSYLSSKSAHCIVINHKHQPHTVDLGERVVETNSVGNLNFMATRIQLPCKVHKG